MPKEDGSNREVSEIFEHIRSERTLDDIKTFPLPDNPTVLRRLGARCLEESRKAMRAGHHTEARRLEILAKQLQKRAESVERNK